MHIVSTVAELHSIVKEQLKKGLKVGLVPTMGALHEGHLTLVRQCAAENDCVVVSVFVNPTQFNDPKDLERYPRTLEADCALLEGSGCSVVFAPTVKEVYPVSEKAEFEFGALATVMEGVFRPGHFDGVAQVVGRLFELVTPHTAYFGEKDFQQLAIIRELVRQKRYAVEIVACAIVREEDGLAMSSRNRLLTAEQRALAPCIYEVLKRSVELKEEGMSANEVSEWVTKELSALPGCRLEYFQLADVCTLQPFAKWTDVQKAVGCVALYCGEVRLIDNIIY